MDNSLVTHLQGYVQAMFKDMEWMYASQSDWRRDQSRLLHELENRGSRVLTLDLPAIAKHLDRCLDEGSFTPYTGYLSDLGAHGYPKFLWILWKRVFPDGKLGSTPDFDAITALRQVLLSCKKLRLICTHRRVGDELRKFFQLEQELRSPTNSWVDDETPSWEIPVSFTDGLPGSDSSPDLFGFGNFSQPKEHLRLLHLVCDRVAAQLGDLHSEDPTELPKHGPGAVANFNKNRTSKFDFTDWPQKLGAIFPYDYYGTHDFMSSNLSYDEGLDAIRNREVAAKLICVPKTQKAPRLIAVEPNQHQWIQQLVRNQLEGRFSLTDISQSVSFRDQRPNQVAARVGSEQGLLATVDLSEASDRLTCWVVERVFRSNRTLLDRLHASRTRWLSCQIKGHEVRHVVLRKLGPMGSATTFPVQSIVYACVAVTACLIANKLRPSRSNIRKMALQVTVFGDDIVVPKIALAYLVALLAYLGFKVNTDKTYGSSNFRESCGKDYIRGVDVTPTFLLNPATSVQLVKASSQIAVVNNFWSRGWWHTSLFVEKTISNRNRVPVVGPRPIVLGFISFCGPLITKRGYHRDYQIDTCPGLRVSTRIPLAEAPGRHRMLQWFNEKPLHDSKWSSGIRGEPVVTIRPGPVFLRDMQKQLETVLP